MSENGILYPDTQPRTPTPVDRAMIWLKGRERAFLIVGVVAQLVVLLSMIATHAATLAFGETVFVRVVPVDPRDLFRGDYVILSYEFSRIPPGGIEGLPSSGDYNVWRENQGRTVYVTLVPEGDGKHMKAGRFSVEKPEEGPFLRGRIAGWNQIEYGIEAFFVQEGQGLDYEKAVRDRTLSAELAVTSGGKAALKRLHIAETPAPAGFGLPVEAAPGTAHAEASESVQDASEAADPAP